MGTAEMKDPRRSIDIERLLQWSYRQELPKQDLIGAYYSMRTTIWAYGTPLSGMSGPGAIPECLLDGGPPHEDAVIVHECVCRLDGLSDEWHIDPRDLLSDMSEPVQAEAESLLAGYHVQRAALVMRFARGAGRPDWRVEEPERRPVLSVYGGKPQWWIKRRCKLYLGKGVEAGEEEREVDGFDRVARRPLPGAYHKFYFEPPVRTIFDLRADYCQWHAALCWLVEELRPQLLAYAPVEPAAAAMPWETGEAARPRILQMLGPQAA
jgi:hypothetical protein